VANRRSFEASLAKEWRRAMRAGDPLSLLLIDVDNFKAFNDLYGHQAGDECLRFVTRTIGGAIRRAHDLVARYGGEEFVVMLPATTREGAERTAEAIRATIARRTMPHAATTSGAVAVSVGVATVRPAADSDPAELIEAADGALYAAKRQGRNRVAIAGEREAEPVFPHAAAAD
jgi:diguanylate cyclase (GGDEF)-like protein